jgi:hypothetical protein
VDAPAQSDGVRAETRLPTAGVLEELSSALASARAALSNFLDLMSLEARRAGLALMWMVAWGFVAAICIVAAWLGAMAGFAMWAVSLGIPPIAAVISVAVIDLIAGVALIYVCIGCSVYLLFFSKSGRRGANAWRASPCRLSIDQRQLCSVVRELLALRQLQVGRGRSGREPVREAHRAPAGTADTVTAEHVQTLKMKCRSGAITALHLPRTTQYGAGSELSEACEITVRLRTNGEGSRPVEMAFRLTHEQVTGQYRNDHTRR